MEERGRGDENVFGHQLELVAKQLCIIDEIVVCQLGGFGRACRARRKLDVENVVRIDLGGCFAEADIMRVRLVRE